MDSPKNKGAPSQQFQGGQLIWINQGRELKRLSPAIQSVHKISNPRVTSARHLALPSGGIPDWIPFHTLPFPPPSILTVSAFSSSQLLSSWCDQMLPEESRLEDLEQISWIQPPQTQEAPHPSKGAVVLKGWSWTNRMCITWNLLETQILGPCSRPTKSKAGSAAQLLCFFKPARWFWSH